MALPHIHGLFRIHTKELRYTQSGSERLSLNLVASTKYKTQNGEDKEDVCWVTATAFGKQAEIINQYFNEKDRILIHGSLKLESWTDNQGVKKSKHSIKINEFEFVERRDSQQQQQNAQPTHQAPQQGYTPPQNGNEQVPEIDINDDSIPF